MPAGSFTVSTASGAQTSAGLSARISLRRSMAKAGAPRSAGMVSWKGRYADETSQSLQDKFPTTDVFAHH
jgi:hypothetical protein